MFEIIYVMATYFIPWEVSCGFHPFLRIVDPISNITRIFNIPSPAKACYMSFLMTIITYFEFHIFIKQ